MAFPALFLPPAPSTFATPTPFNLLQPTPRQRTLFLCLWMHRSWGFLASTWSQTSSPLKKSLRSLLQLMRSLGNAFPKEEFSTTVMSFCINLPQTRNVDAKQFLGELPSFVSPVLEKISVFPNSGVCSTILDQLTVNEYPPGVGLAPHIDTHSAFDEPILSLSLAGPCIMELRMYPHGKWLRTPSQNIDVQEESSDICSDFIRKAIFLPPRSMLLLSGEARYAWHHYIPHHKIDVVGENAIRRSSRRVSLTFRKVRTIPCSCEYPQYCDSQQKEVEFICPAVVTGTH